MNHLRALFLLLWDIFEDLKKHKKQLLNFLARLVSYGYERHNQTKKEF